MRSRIVLVLLIVASACSAESPPVETTSTSAVVTTTAASTAPSTTVEASTTTASTATTTTVPVEVPGMIDVAFADGTVTGGGRVVVPLGEETTIRVTSDVADEVHVHVYDLYLDVEPGVPGEVTFVADIPGVVEVELEGQGVTLVELEVGG